MENIIFEEAKEEHLQELLDIYTYYVLNTTATFHDHTVTMDEMRSLVIFDNPVYRTFIMRMDRSRIICGYVILTQHKKREAYDKTAEITVYLRPEYTGKGIGTRAIGHIEKYAKEVDMHALIATICGQNTNSISLFKHCGYFNCAHYKEVGRKFGQVLDVVSYEKILD
jgi:phosphinothricin acetyltransferase